MLALLATPRTYTQIASELYISRNTVKTHVSNLYTKLGVSTRYEAIERARAAGLLPDDGVLEGEHLRCEALLSTSPDLVIVVDSEQHVICANRTLAEMRGKADVQAGQELNALIHPGDRARVRALIANAVHSPSDAVAFDCRFTCADASSRDLEVLLVNRLDDPAVRGLVLYARDTMYRQAPALRRVVAVRTPDETRRVARELRQQSLDVRASSLALQIRTAMLVRRTPSAPRGSRSQSYVATRATDSDRARS